MFLIEVRGYSMGMFNRYIGWYKKSFFGMISSQFMRQNKRMDLARINADFKDTFVLVNSVFYMRQQEGKECCGARPKYPHGTFFYFFNRK